MKIRCELPCAVAFAVATILLGCVHSRETKVNLSTPESTIAGFTKAAAKGDAALAESYFLPGGVDYQDIVDTLTARPGTPGYAARAMMESVDISKPVTLKSQEETEHGLKAGGKSPSAPGLRSRAEESKPAHTTTLMQL